MGLAKRKKKGETAGCEIEVDLSTSGVQENGKKLVLEGNKQDYELRNYRRVTIHNDQELNNFWSENVELFNRIGEQEGSNANKMYCGRAGLMESLASYCKSSHNVTSIHQEYLDIIYGELSKQKFELKCLKKQHEKEIALMRSHFEEQIETFKASNARLLQKIELIIAEKKGVGKGPIKKLSDQKKEKTEFIFKANKNELENVIGKRIPSSSSFNVFLRQVTSAVKGNRKLLKKNIYLTEKTENGWTAILKNWKKEQIKVPVKSSGKSQIKEQTNRYSPFLVGLKQENDLVKERSQKKVMKTFIGKTTDKKIDLPVKGIKAERKSDLMTKTFKKQNKEVIHKKKNISEKEIKKSSSWVDQLSREEKLKIALEGKKPKQCRYKLLLVYGLPPVDHINREIWASLLGVNEKHVPLIKDLKEGGRIFLLRDEACIQAIRGIYEISKEAEVILEIDKISSFITNNKNSLMNVFANISPMWKKYVPVDQAIKFIKKGLAEKSKISQKEYFFDEDTYECLKKEGKGVISIQNDQ